MQHEGLARQQAMIPNYWPTAHQALCLRAALLRGEAGLAAWRRLAAMIDPERLDAASQSLLPLVYQNLARLAARDPRIEALGIDTSLRGATTSACTTARCPCCTRSSRPAWMPSSSKAWP